MRGFSGFKESVHQTARAAALAAGLVGIPANTSGAADIPRANASTEEEYKLTNLDILKEIVADPGFFLQQIFNEAEHVADLIEKTEQEGQPVPKKIITRFIELETFFSEMGNFTKENSLRILELRKNYEMFHYYESLLEGKKAHLERVKQTEPSPQILERIVSEIEQLNQDLILERSSIKVLEGILLKKLPSGITPTLVTPTSR